MKPFQSLTVPEQLAAHLRREMENGALHGFMPGVLRLERETGVNRKTVEAALRILEADGLLAAQGAGKRRRIVAPDGLRSGRSLRLAFLLFERNDRGAEIIIELRHTLSEAGHEVIHAPRSLLELGMDAARVARMVGQVAADGWVVIAGSKEVLEWFAAKGIPVMAVFGRRRAVPIASVGPDKIPAIREVARTLLRLGHRRIVLLTRRVNRLPHPIATVQAFLDELSAHGTQPGSYHLPEWKETVDGFHDSLSSLFRVTPPTAMVVDEIPLMIATQQFLAAKRLRIPQEVSLVCMDGSPDFAWSCPAISHVRWDHGPLVRRVLRWANRLTQGKQDLRHVFIPAEFVRGGTIGRAAEPRET